MKETNFNFKTGTSFEHFSARNKNLITMRDRGIFNFTSNLFKKNKIKIKKKEIKRIHDSLQNSEKLPSQKH
jgi:hypothetical protein